MDLLRARETLMIQELGKVTMEKIKAGKDFYQIWMKEDNDIVQEVAQCYGDRRTVEFCHDDIQRAPAGAKTALTQLLNLYSLSVIRENLSWFMIKQLVNVKAAESVEINYKRAIQDLQPLAFKAANGFGIPEHLLTAPIAQDYEDYNSRPNLGEVFTPKL